MNEEWLFQRDAYLRRFSARVAAVTPTGVRLDRTAFYPTGGGQPSDTGTLHDSSAGVTWNVVAATKLDDGIDHTLEPSDPRPQPGSIVEGTIDWPRRYAHMRYHTLLHVLSGVVFQRYASGISGGQIAVDGARMDFALPEFSREVAGSLVEEVNRVAATPLSVAVRFVPRAELARDPTLVRVAAELLPTVDPVRLIDIGGFDVQADGGTHVRSTGELGSAVVTRLENKGARNKRLYVRLPAVEPPELGPNAGGPEGPRSGRPAEPRAL